MKETLTFSKEIVFKDNIASITSISLEHEEKVYSGEINGEFVVFGDYKTHNDTTETENFKFNLPFTMILPPDVDYDTVEVQISNFTYDQVEDDVLSVFIEYIVTGDFVTDKLTVADIDFLSISNLEGRDNDTDVSFDEFIDSIEDDDSMDSRIEEDSEESKDSIIIDDIEKEEIVEEEINIEKKEIDTEEKIEEYVTYHVHVFKSNDVIEEIVKMYNGNIDVVKELNDIKNIKVGDKIIIPEYVDE